MTKKDGASVTTLLKPDSISTVAALGRLLVRHSRAGLFDGVDADVEAGSAHPEELTDDLESMGPTWIKLGQLLSTRRDLVPEAYVEALQRLQERVKPFDSEEAKALVEEELGVELHKAFLHFEDEPMAAGSLAQVHRAVLRDDRAVAVKVQRPDAEKQVRKDLEVLRELAHLLEERTETGERIGSVAIFEEMRDALMEELDFRVEMRNLQSLGAAVEEYDRLTAPKPIPDYCSRRVLTMELVPGRSVGALSPMARNEIEARPILEEVIRAYLDMALIHGLVHADPHPGNFMITEDRRLAMVDAGMVILVPEHHRDTLLRLLVAMSEGHGSDVADIIQAMSVRHEQFRPERFRERAAQVVARHRVGTERPSIGRLVLEICRIGVEEGLRVPRSTTLFGKTLLNLDETARLLDPEFKADEVVRDTTAELAQRRSIQSLAPSQVLKGIIESKEFMLELPRRVGNALDRLGEDRFEIRVHLPDDSPVMRAAQKMANRITAGLVIAALIIGAALIMRVPTDFQILGYPGLAIIFFFMAAVAALALISRVWKDV